MIKKIIKDIFLMIFKKWMIDKKTIQEKCINTYFNSNKLIVIIIINKIFLNKYHKTLHLI